MKKHQFLLKKLAIYGLAAMHLTGSALPVAAHTKTTEHKTEEVHKKAVTDNTAKMEKVAKEKNTFDEENVDVVFVKDAAAKSAPDGTGEVVASFNKGDEAVLVGSNDYADWKIEVDGDTYYVNQHAIKDKKEVEKLEAETKKQEAKSYSWNGSVLSASAGVNQGPTGKETYYNLPMEGVVSIMRGMGNNDPYWVREDGVKMLGDYVIVAANLSMFPRGSLVPTSLGMGLVCDTGGFAAHNPTQLDIATAW